MIKAELVLTTKAVNIKTINIEPDVTCYITCTYCKHRHDKIVEINENTAVTTSKGQTVNLQMKCRNCEKKMVCSIKSVQKQKENNFFVALFEINGCAIENIIIRKILITSLKGSKYEIDGMPNNWKGKDFDGKEVSYVGLIVKLVTTKK